MATTSRRAAARTALIVGALSVGAASLAACGSTPTADLATQPAANAKPVYGGTLRALDYLSSTCLSPSGSTAYKDSVISNQLYDRLAYQNPDTGEITPWLATSWKVNDDATKYTFTLRSGVTFSDGTPLTPQVVKDNFDQQGLGAPDLGITKNTWVANYASSAVEGPDTVSFSFSAPSVGFLQATTYFGFGIGAASTLTLKNEDRCQGKNVVGTGPFVYESDKKDKEVVIKRREDYNWAPPAVKHEGKAYLEHISYTVVPEGSVRLGSLLAGQADTARGILPTDEAIVNGTPGYSVITLNAGQSNLIGINADAPFLDDVRVRQALLAATDRQEIKTAVLSDSYKLAVSSLSAGNPAAADLTDSFRYDVTKANQLLDAAGWVKGSSGYREKDGKELGVQAYVTPHHITSSPLYELLVEQWKKVGIKLELHRGDLSVWAKALRDPQINGLIQTSPTRFDADSLRTTWDSKAGNLVNHSFPELEDLLRRQNAETDPAKRKDLAAQAQKYLIDNGLVLPLYDDVLVYGTSTKVHGIDREPQGRPYYLNTWIEQ